MYAAGISRPDIAGVFGVSKHTITQWLKREDVQLLITAVIRQRANRIMRSTDAEIAGRLENEEARARLDLKDLIAIRREFSDKTGRGVPGGTGSEFADIEYDVWEALDSGDEILELPEAEVVEE